jgi:XTP/dITP diphosphohydrolase
MNLVFASGNANKVKEINEILRNEIPISSALRGVPDVTVISMKDIGCTADIPETTGTIRGNAIQKATYLWYNYRVNCFSEDTGLEIDALDSAPGVDTAHYSGSRDADANIALVLKNLNGKSTRSARFRTVIALILDNKLHVFEGICAGEIALQKSKGIEGFGYDPIFRPDGYDKTFAELGSEVKSVISHRARAMQQLLDFLKAT